MIKAQDVSIGIAGRTILSDISLALARGRVTVILGANGAGKTSLLKALAGLLRPNCGQITLQDHPIHSLGALVRAKQIGYLPQDGTPQWAVTVRDLVALGRLPHQSPFSAPSTRDLAAINEAMIEADILHLADRTVDTLSGGELARAKFARVLAGQSDWLLVDEPLASLDPSHQKDVLALLRSAAANGKGVAVVLHQLAAAAQVADDIVLLKDGSLLASGPQKDVFTGPLLSQCFGMEMEVVTLGKHKVVLPQ